MNLGSNSVASSVIICKESVRLFYTHPILLVYGILPALLSIPLSSIFVVSRKPILGLLCIACTIFFRFCLAHHSMHILRKQASSIQESCRAIVQRYPYVLCWIAIEAAYIVALIWLQIKTHTVFNVFFLFLAIISILGMGTSIMIPALATKDMSLLRAVKNVVRIVWNNCALYIMVQAILIALSLCSTIFLSFLLRLLSYAVPVISKAYVWPTTFACACMFILPLLTVANTIFYYEFYVKRELELQEIFFTTQA